MLFALLFFSVIFLKVNSCLTLNIFDSNEVGNKNNACNHPMFCFCHCLKYESLLKRNVKGALRLGKLKQKKIF